MNDTLFEPKINCSKSFFAFSYSIVNLQGEELMKLIFACPTLYYLKYLKVILNTSSDSKERRTTTWMILRAEYSAHIKRLLIENQGGVIYSSQLYFFSAALLHKS